jgi:hypothetical protein
MKSFRLPAAAALFLAAACSSMRVAVQFDEKTDFRAYRTFQFGPSRADRPGPGRNPLFTKEVLAEIRGVLVEKGLTEAARPDEADLSVHFYAMVRNQRDFAPPVYRVGRHGRVWRAGPGHVVNYKEGTLVVDLVDRRRNELVWQGAGKGVLDRNDPANRLVEAVKEVLASYPPGN